MGQSMKGMASSIDRHCARKGKNNSLVLKIYNI